MVGGSKGENFSDWGVYKERIGLLGIYTFAADAALPVPSGLLKL